MTDFDLHAWDEIEGPFNLQKKKEIKERKKHVA